MENYRASSVVGPRVVHPWRLIKCGLWLRLAFIGGGSALLGLVMLFTSETEPIIASLWALGGALVGRYSLTQSWALINQNDRVDDSVADTLDLRADPQML